MITIALVNWTILTGGGMKKFSMVISILVILFWTNFAIAQQPVRFAVLAKRGVEKAMMQWSATGDYLSKKLKREVRIVPLKFVEIEKALKKKSIDFLLANPAFYARFEKKYNLKAITTMVNKKGFVALNEFSGVIFVRNDSKIQDLQDIRGKHYMCVKYSSFGGAYMALRLLIENGIDPKKDCASYTQGGTHDNVVMAILQRKVDVGTVRSDTLERMAAEGTIRMDAFRIINESRDGFPFVHSTQLYPEWPIAACQTTDPKLSKDFAKAMILLNSTHKAMKDAKVYSWTYPAKYGEVTACLRKIGAL
jgi:phosphate/phosphite/phosphonate ABC transporter binding protein